MNVFPARGTVGRVTDGVVRGLWFKSRGSILTLEQKPVLYHEVVRGGGDPIAFSVPLSGEKSVMQWSLRLIS